MSKKKYTASEWAAMEGGHSVEENKSQFQLINTLTESRLFRNKNIVSSVKVDDAAELAFVHFLMLNVMNKDYDFAPLASEYAGRTSAFKNFDYFRTSGTDLYIALNRIMGKDQDYSNDKDEIAMKRISIKKPEVVRYLNHISASKSDSGFEKAMLMRFERNLNVQDGMLKSMRRLVGDWDNLNQNQRALVVTRMVQYMRSKAPRSEMMPALLKFQKRGNYVVNDKEDKKKKVWDSPIAKGAVAIGAIYGAARLGKYLGKTSYQTGRNSGSKFQPRGNQK